MIGSAGDKEGVYLAKVDSDMWDINLQRYYFAYSGKLYILFAYFIKEGGKNVIFILDASDINPIRIRMREPEQRLPERIHIA